MIAKVIGWKDLNGFQFAKAKDRLGIIHFYKRIVDEPRFRALPEESRSRITGPEQLVVSAFYLKKCDVLIVVFIFKMFLLRFFV